MLRKTILLIFALVIFAAGVWAQNDGAPTKTAPAATAETAKTTTRFTPSKAQIQAGQEFLKAKKLYNGDTEGKYNDDTRAAIKVFQKDNGLPLTGNFNQATLEKMNIPLTDKQKGAAPAVSVATGTSPAAVTPTKTSIAPVAGTAEASDDASKETKTTAESPKRGPIFQATKDQIMALQKVLIADKLFSGEANGERSEALKEAVKKYQETKGLNATGGINAATLKAMGIELTDRQKAQAAPPAAATKPAN